MLKKITNEKNVQNYNGKKQVPFNMVSYCGNAKKGAKSKKNFSTTITNLTDEALTVALSYGFMGLSKPLREYLQEKLGIDYFLNEGTIDDGEETPTDVLTVVSKRMPLDLFIFLNATNPTAIEGFRISSFNRTSGAANETQFNTLLERHIINPYEGTKDITEIDLSQYMNLESYKAGIIDVDQGFTADSNGIIILKVDANTKLGLDMFMGPTVNPGKALEQYLK